MNTTKTLLTVILLLTLSFSVRAEDLSEKITDGEKLREELKRSSSLNSGTPASSAAVVPEKPLTGNTDASAAYSEGYGPLKWGSSRIKARTTFAGMSFSEQEHDSLCSAGEISGEQILVFLRFTRDRLFWAANSFIFDTSNNDVYIYKFQKIEELLSQEHGEPATRLREVNASDYTDDADAILAGDGIYADIWVTPETKIMLMLTGQDSELHLDVVYVCTSLERTLDGGI